MGGKKSKSPPKSKLQSSGITTSLSTHRACPVNKQVTISKYCFTPRYLFRITPLIDCGSRKSLANSPGLSQRWPGFKLPLGHGFRCPTSAAVLPCEALLSPIPAWGNSLGLAHSGRPSGLRKPCFHIGLFVADENQSRLKRKLFCSFNVLCLSLIKLGSLRELSLLLSPHRRR